MLKLQLRCYYLFNNLDMNFVHILALFSILIGNIVVSLYIFSNGFLIRRLSLNDTNIQIFKKLKKFDRTVVLFVDALRFDFIFSRSNTLFGIPTIENLVKNAIDAMRGRGSIAVKVEDDGKTTKIKVTDSGKGIPKKQFKTISI